MWGFSLKDAVTNRAAEFFHTSFGVILGVTTPQKEESIWNNVSWTAAVSESVLASPNGEGSIEICDLIITGEKKAGGSITIHFDDGTNEKNVVKASVDDSSLNLAMSLTGKVQGWIGAKLYYTIVGTFVGSITISYIKHNKKASDTYALLAEECGW